jgi:hypothetical protein
VIIILPLDTIGRILDQAAPPSGAASRAGRPKAGPVLAKSVIDALNKARNDKANIVGPLEPKYFNDLSAWCRSSGLIGEGETVEAAVRASG